MTTQGKLATQSGRSRAKAADTVSPMTGADAIARRACELFQQRGGEPGRALDDWLRAEREVTESKNRKQYSSNSTSPDPRGGAPGVSARPTGGSRQEGRRKT